MNKIKLFKILCLIFGIITVVGSCVSVYNLFCNSEQEIQPVVNNTIINQTNNTTQLTHQTTHHEAVEYNNRIVMDLQKLKNSPEYKAGYRDYPNNTTYNKVSRYDAYVYQPSNGDALNKITAYCIGFEAAKIDEENKVREIAHNKALNNATKLVEQRVNISEA